MAHGTMPSPPMSSHEVVADDDVEAREPAPPLRVVTLRRDGGTVDLPDDVALDGQAVEAAGLAVADRCGR